MLNSMFPHESFLGQGRRRSLLATVSAVALLGLCFGLGTAFGQDDQSASPPPPPAQQAGQQSDQGMGRHMGHRSMPNVDDQLKHLNAKLNLSDDQQAKLKPILEDQHKQMEQIHNDSSLAREDRFNKMRELRQNSDTQIRSVLNEDQQKNFDKMREEQRGRMKWHKGGKTVPPGGPDSQR